MSTEYYALEPAAVEVFPVGSATDVILRRGIHAVDRTGETDSENFTGWECEEKQLRYDGTLTKEEVLEDFDSWWEYTADETAAELTPIEVLTAKIDYIAMMCDVEMP